MYRKSFSLFKVLALTGLLLLLAATYVLITVIQPRRLQASQSGIAIANLRVDALNRIRIVDKDLGRVLPGEHRTVDFALRNDSGFDWIIESITPSCSCTVPMISFTRISAGETVTFRVAYAAPSSPQDHTAKTMVRFKNSSAPLIEMRLRSHVRKPLTIQPKEAINCGRVIANAVKKVEFDVENHSESRWDTIAIEDTDFASFGIQELHLPPPRSHECLPKQLWRVSASIRVGDATADTQQSIHTIRAISPELLSATLKLQWQPSVGILAVPSECFLGYLEPGGTAECKLLLNVIDQDLNGTPYVKCSPDEVLAVTVNGRRGRNMTADISLKVPDDHPSGLFEGKVLFRFNEGPEMVEKAVSVKAFIR